VIARADTGAVICKNVFTLKSCAPIVGAQVLSFNNEKQLLTAWKEFFSTVRPRAQLVAGSESASRWTPT
jgi:DNA polymerase delta subunit 1